MANAEPCEKCGYQESRHDKGLYPKLKTCDKFVSVVKHKPGCPVIGCEEDCDKTIEKANWERTVQEHRMSNVIFFTRQGIILLDIGS